MIIQPKGLPDGDPGLAFTASAIEHVERSLKDEDDKDIIGIRVGVKKAGCSGYEYLVEYAKNTQVGDFVFQVNKSKVIVDKETYLQFFKGGTVLDYRKDGLNVGLEFDNPNVRSQCGCGESFALVKE